MFWVGPVMLWVGPRMIWVGSGTGMFWADHGMF